VKLSFRKYCDILEGKGDPIFASVICKLCHHLLKRTYRKYSKQIISFVEFWGSEQKVWESTLYKDFNKGFSGVIS
jgi:hypothetical protein